MACGIAKIGDSSWRAAARLALVATSCVLSVTWARPCSAQGAGAKPKTSTGRFFAGGQIHRSLRETIDDERPWGPQVDSIRGGAIGGLEVEFSRFLGALALGRAYVWATDWSTKAREMRSGIDLCLAPVAGVPFRIGRARMRVYSYFPIGYTIPWIEAGEHRAIRETYTDGQGYNFGPVLGLGWRSNMDRAIVLGAFAEWGLIAHRMRFTHEVETTSPPRRSLSEEYHVEQFDLMLSFGGDFWF